MNRKRIFTVAVVALFFGFCFCLPAFWVGAGYREIYEVRAEFEALSDDQYDEIIDAAIAARARWMEERESSEGWHPNRFTDDDIPAELRFLEPRVVTFHDSKVTILLFASFRIWADITIMLDDPDQVKIIGFFGEPETADPPQVLYRRPLP